jgi:hypothetical protein
MATPEERAVALKNEGNKAFASHDWAKAINFYSQAIELNGKEPTYFSNRAQVSTPYCFWSSPPPQIHIPASLLGKPSRG